MVLNGTELLLGLLGGVVIGLSVTLMLLLKGRVTGISGIINGFLKRSQGDWAWRGLFLLGLVLGGLALKWVYPEALVVESNRSAVHLAAAGLLVGFGTLLGNGCTSGHGVCGLSRFSVRSFVATLIFMAFGIMAATLTRLFLV